MEALDLMVMFPIDNCQPESGEIKAVLLMHSLQRELTHELGFCIVGKAWLKAELLILSDLFSGWQDSR